MTATNPLTKHRAVCANLASVQALRNALDCGCYSETANSRWYCVETNPKAEFSVLAQVIAPVKQGGLALKAHLPTHVAARERIRARTVRHAGIQITQPERTVDTIRPWLPGYLFVRFDAERDDWAPLFRTPGVRRLFMIDRSRPMPVPDNIVEKIIAQGRPGDGVIDDAYVGPIDPNLAPGQRLRITSGPFADMTGICTITSGRRVALLLEAMDGVQVKVERSSVEVA